MTSTPSAITGPGLLYVNSRILDPTVLPESQFLQWYSQDHIPEIIATGGVASALRFKSPDENAATAAAAKRPYLALYPMRDIAFTQGEAFRGISVHSDLLPDGGPIYDLAEFDTRYYGLVQCYAPRGAPKAGQLRTLVTAGFEFEGKDQDEDFDNWYRKEHLEQVSQVPGYLRTTRFKLLYHRNNATSRRLKGLEARPEDLNIADPPTNLAIHEFSSKELDVPALMKTAETEWSRAVMGRSVRTETPIFRFEEAFGSGEFFDWFEDGR